MKKARPGKLKDIELIKCKVYINHHVRNVEFRSLFLRFLEKDYSQRIFTENDRWTIHRWFEEIVVSLFTDYTIKQISWEQYCVNMKNIRTRNWKDYNSKFVLSGIRKVARMLLSSFYNYTVEKVNDTKAIIKLKKHKELLIWEERTIYETVYCLSEHQIDRIGTNFPIVSSIEQLQLIPGEGTSKDTILNLNVSQEEIKKILIGFYKSEGVHFKNYNPIRQFIYLFRYSLLALEREPQNITDFTFDVFKKQYRFYKKANIINTTASRSLFIILIRFYVYLSKIIKDNSLQHDIFNGFLYNEVILGSNSFSIMYERGYKIITYNAFEETPVENRWQLKTPDGHASLMKNALIGCDFTQVENKTLREDLKNYIWKQSNMSVTTAVTGINRIAKFLNFISYYKQYNELNGFVNADLLEQWSFYIGSFNPENMNNYVKHCRAYLKFYKVKYQIPSILIDILKQQRLDTDGGIPMTKHDVELFSKKFQEQRARGTIGELCYIIFNLAATTKLRSGEILSLERDCIIEKSERTGVVQYYSKTTGNQKIKVTLTLEKIKLIEKAIYLTQEAHSKANVDFAKFIFIKEDYWRRDRVIGIVSQFAVVFSDIQKKLEAQLDNKYRPYSLRTTFIDNLYNEGINDGLPTSVIAEIAGNGEKTALRYYRKSTTAQAYAEMFSGVVISGVNIYGNIIEEKDIEDHCPVEDGLGGCNQEGCVRDEEQYQCLICPHFATTINRIPLFKERITRLKLQKEATLSNHQRNLYEAELKLYIAYYVKLLDKVGGEIDRAEF